VRPSSQAPDRPPRHGRRHPRLTPGAVVVGPLAVGQHRHRHRRRLGSGRRRRGPPPTVAPDPSTTSDPSLYEEGPAVNSARVVKAGRRPPGGEALTTRLVDRRHHGVGKPVRASLYAGPVGPGGEWISSLYRLLGGGLGRVGDSGGPSHGGPSGGQRGSRGICRSEGLPLGEHVPDGVGELAGEFDAGDLGAALLAQEGLGAEVVGAVEGVAGGADGGLDERPAEVLGTVFGQGTAMVPPAGLVDPGAEAGVAAGLLRGSV